MMAGEFTNHGIAESRRGQQHAIYIIEIVETVTLVHFGFFRVGNKKPGVLSHAFMLGIADKLGEGGIADIGNGEQNKTMFGLPDREWRDGTGTISQSVRCVEDLLRRGFADMAWTRECP